MIHPDIPIPPSVLELSGLMARDSGVPKPELDGAADWTEADFSVDDQVALEILAEDE